MIDRDSFQAAAEATHHKWHAVLQAIRAHDRIETTPTGDGITTRQIWTLKPTTEGETA